ncbi:MAG: 2-oxoacid:acceptor oxidoreductase family protein [Planctomycetota bacterium]|jgi:pyruvate-ferredoxin/flavodoxin oxidoreductase|nr:2-oxoacid:acceptor oxidoreductase family protein [Planctomycetota bacterium]
MSTLPKYPGKRITTNGNQLVAQHTEPLIADAGVFYPITPSTEQGENFQMAYAQGRLNAFGQSFIAMEAEGEHAAQGGAIAASVTGKRVVNFTSGQGIVYGLEQYYHAPGKLSTMVLEVGARALTKHALNVHCGHDDVYAALDTGWISLFSKDAQQASDQAIILRRVTELALNPGMNAQDGFLTTHLERTFRAPEPALIREFLGRPDDEIECPTEAQRTLFGATRRRVPEMIDLKRPLLLGPVQNQEHYMNGVAARRNNFAEHILGMLEESYADFGKLTGRNYGLVSPYRCDDADTVFVALGSAAENIEAAVDHLRDTRQAKVGVLHINVLRPFPVEAVVNAIKGKKQIVVLERTDEPLAGDNPLTRDIRASLAQAVAGDAGLTAITPDQVPEIISGSYGLGSRDFRPEGVIGAYEFAVGERARQDGKKVSDGERFIFVGIDHPYAVKADETPSLLPKGAIAVRLHSIGGWGMITTGKNLGEILGTLSNAVAKKRDLKDADGTLAEIVHISANPKYGSEKKGSPTNYFMVAAPERIRVNCDLEHVDVVLCCDPKAFLHTNPLTGLRPGGAFVWEADGISPENLWLRIPPAMRQEVIDKELKLYALDGFKIAKAATSRPDLQTRMQGNSFLGAFFKVSSFLAEFEIDDALFRSTVEAQYRKKFGRFGDAVVESNMAVMTQGLETLQEIPHGAVDAEDRANCSAPPLCPSLAGDAKPAEAAPPIYSKSCYDAEFRAGLGYHQPSTALSSVGSFAAATGAGSSKYVARRAVPVWLADNCTQCMECISVCPDTALPNTAQDISTVLRTSIRHYVSDPATRKAFELHVVPLSQSIRTAMKESLAAKADLSFADIAKPHLMEVAANDAAISNDAAQGVASVLDTVPWAFRKTRGIFELLEKKQEGNGGVFGIFVSDLCKGCGACVDACGDHQALVMEEETEERHAEMLGAESFLELLPDTPQKYLGMLDPEHIEDARAAALRSHLMLQSKYTALVSGDGACAGCGEKNVLRPVATLTETLMRPVFHRKSARLSAKAAQLAERGMDLLAAAKKANPEAAATFKKAVLHAVMGYGGVDQDDTNARIAAEWQGDDRAIIDALRLVIETDASNHKDIRTVEGRTKDGMCAMAMTAHTGCNTVFGSTPPNNPHPYPWMNSLFQDGATIGWLVGESFIQNHSRRSVVPERLADALLASLENGFGEEDYFLVTHMTDTFMTDIEVLEIPKVWVIGGDGGMGDIGFQNVSKVVLQNRPNVKMLMLNTQVYSNTGGQNSESSVLTGGFDMNQVGAASDGKLSEMKSVAECLLGGHGSPYVAQLSIANTASLYKALVDGLCYRGTAFFQVYTACMPEHGIGDDASLRQAIAARDSRCVPEFIYDPALGESFLECLSIKGNTDRTKDWMQKRIPGEKKEKYVYTIAHWAATEARFRNHVKPVKGDGADLMPIEDILAKVTMNDIRHRYHLIKGHPAYIPNFEVKIVDYAADGSPIIRSCSRQLVVFCIERRRAWRMLQSRAGIENVDYTAQKQALADAAK